MCNKLRDVLWIWFGKSGIGSFWPEDESRPYYPCPDSRRLEPNGAGERGGAIPDAAGFPIAHGPRSLCSEVNWPMPWNEDWMTYRISMRLGTKPSKARTAGPLIPVGENLSPLEALSGENKSAVRGFIALCHQGAFEIH